MPSFFDDTVRHMLQQLAATYRVHQRDHDARLGELEVAMDALMLELETNGSAAARDLGARARDRFGRLRDASATMGVFAAEPRERQPLARVVEAALRLATSESGRPLELVVDGPTYDDEAPEVVDAAFHAQRLAAELGRLSLVSERAELRWYRERSSLAVELVAQPADDVVARLEMTTVDPLASGIVPRMDGLRVLAVDDDPTIRKVVARCLRHAGHRVQAAVDVDDAMRWASHAPFDAVVTDVDMPGGGGFELLRRLRAERPQLAERLTFLTGLAGDPLTRERLVASGRPHLGKPFDDRALLAMIVRAAADRSERRESGTR
ncbi:MAG: response regulator [Polyangiaceae bacterium]